MISLSRIQLRFERLTPAMMSQWTRAAPYAAHQWLWQLFPGASERPFLFRQEPQARFFVLSDAPPASGHPLFVIETKPFRPQISAGQVFEFQLRANPVITRQKKRYDVLMDAKFQARARGEVKEAWWDIQTGAAFGWLEKQGAQHGFTLLDAAPAMRDGRTDDETRIRPAA